MKDRGLLLDCLAVIAFTALFFYDVFFSALAPELAVLSAIAVVLFSYAAYCKWKEAPGNRPEND